MIKINGKEFKYSFSQNRTYEDCPMKYFFKYHEGIDEPSNENLELGSAIHKLLELRWWDINEDNYYDVPQEEFEKGLDAEKLVKQRKGRMYLEQLLDELRLFFVDKTIHYNEAVVFIDDCICKIDIIYSDNNDPDKLILADFKVTKNPKNAADALTEGQLLLYKKAIMQDCYLKLMFDKDYNADDICVEYINILPYAAFKIVNPSGVINITKTDCDNFYNGMTDNIEKINSLQFPKKKKWCRWCHYKDMCDSLK